MDVVSRSKGRAWAETNGRIEDSCCCGTDCARFQVCAEMPYARRPRIYIRLRAIYCISLPCGSRAVRLLFFPKGEKLDGRQDYNSNGHNICLIEGRLHLRSGPLRRARDDRIVNSIFPPLFLCVTLYAVFMRRLLLFGKVVCAYYIEVFNPRWPPLCTSHALEFF